MNAAPITTQQLAEQAGSALADQCLTCILNAVDQAESVAALKSTLLALRRLPHPDRAAGGFAVALVATLEHGMGVQL
jgi:hypothetical protein